MSRQQFKIIICLLAISVFGCKEVGLRSQLKELMASTIVLPEKVLCVYNNEAYPIPDSLRSRPRLIVYIDSTECSTCQISHFWEYQDVFDLSSQTGLFDVMILMWDTDIESIPLERYLCDQNLAIPVYVDKSRRFLSDNPVIPDDARMHCLLVDGNGRPKFVGNPCASGHMLSAFKMALQQFID